MVSRTNYNAYFNSCGGNGCNFSHTHLNIIVSSLILPVLVNTHPDIIKNITQIFSDNLSSA